MRNFRVAYTGDFLNERGDYAYGDNSLGLLAACPFVRYHFLKDLGPRAHDPDYWQRFYSLEVTAEHIRDIDGLVVLRPWVTRQTFAQGAGVFVVIGRSGAGYDKIDLEACTDNDVAVFNVPHALDHATASAALLFMLALSKRLKEQEHVARAGCWERQAEVMGSEIEGRTLGIIGFGNSGRELVRLVAPFAMRLMVYSRHTDSDQAAAMGIKLTSLEELLRESDFVSLHARLTEQTRRMIGPAELALMKPTAFFINVARGELVDETALVDALRTRQIAGAALDVFENEPLPADHPLTKLDNVILTPHWLCSSTDVWRATSKAMATGMLRAAQGQVPENVVNPAVLDRPEFQAKLARFEENSERRV